MINWETHKTGVYWFIVVDGVLNADYNIHLLEGISEFTQKIKPKVPSSTGFSIKLSVFFNGGHGEEFRTN